MYINFAGLELKLGGTNVYYAYACDPVTVDITSRFAFSKDTIRTNSYTLPVVPGGKITWEIVSAPPGSLPEIKEVTNKETGYTSIKLIGMIANGDYHLSGIFIPNGSPEGGKEKIPLELVVTRLAEEGKIEGFHVLDEDAGAHLGNIKMVVHSYLSIMVQMVRIWLIQTEKIMQSCLKVWELVRM